MPFSIQSRGFTLIELLVVVAIIGLLSSLVLASLSDAQLKGRDARRLSDVNEINHALELYYTDHGQYPPISFAYTDSTTCGGGGKWCDLEAALEPYMSELPHDPAGLQTTYRYYYDANSGDSYQTFGFRLRFEDAGNYRRANNDGGYENNDCCYYEVGAQPSYCMKSNKNWWYDDSTAVCEP